MRQTRIYHLGYDSEVILDVHQKIVINEKFQSVLKKVRTEFGVPELGKTTYGELFLMRKNPKLIKKTQALIKEFGLPKTWEDIILKYILEDDIFPDYNPNGLSLEIKNEGDRPDEEYYLRIFPQTSIKEIKDAWPDIQKKINTNKIKTRKKTKGKLVRDMEIFRLYKTGKSISEIYTLIKKQFPSEDLDFGNIKVIISNYKKFVKG
jgi:hypothetical protein